MRLALLVSTTILMHVGSAIAQSATFKDELTGESVRTWVQEKLVLFKGVGDTSGCISGQVYEFDRSGFVKHIRCENGQVSARNLAWSVREHGNGIDQILRIGNQDYYLSFSGASCGQQMRIRMLTPSRNDMTTDLYLRRSCN